MRIEYFQATRHSWCFSLHLFKQLKCMFFQLLNQIAYYIIPFPFLDFFLMVVYSSFIVTFGQISRYYPYFIPNSTTELPNPLILLFIQIPLIAFLSLNLLGGLLLATSRFMLSHSFLFSFSSELVVLQANLNCPLPHFLSWVSFLPILVEAVSPTSCIEKMYGS